MPELLALEEHTSLFDRAEQSDDPTGITITGIDRQYLGALQLQLDTYPERRDEERDEEAAE